mmetsp:Transcript_7840/g.17025  ORF Transcript_7840/g.17025 Transcript_7840/m.17025 type:complete len:96 (+) Transcript_7840:253-540(+)
MGTVVSYVLKYNQPNHLSSRIEGKLIASSFGRSLAFFEKNSGSRFECQYKYMQSKIFTERGKLIRKLISKLISKLIASNHRILHRQFVSFCIIAY